MEKPKKASIKKPEMDKQDFQTVEKFVNDKGFTDIIAEIIETDIPRKTMIAWRNADKLGKTYEATYDTLLTAGMNCKAVPSNENIKLLVLAVYGWMPTVLEIDEDVSADDVRKAIDFMGNGGKIESEEGIAHLDVLCRFINNSYIGTSKFLHFLFPKQFAIFDSWIEVALNKLCNKCTKLKIGRRMVFPKNVPVDKVRQAEGFILYELAMRKAAKKMGKSLRDVEKVLFYGFRPEEEQNGKTKAH